MYIYLFICPSMYCIQLHYSRLWSLFFLRPAVANQPLHPTATHCSPLQPTATQYYPLQPTAAHCNPLQPAATHCNPRQPTAAHCSPLRPTATHCNPPQPTTTHCNTHTNLPETTHEHKSRSEAMSDLILHYTGHIICTSLQPFRVFLRTLILHH